jgi:hypothetical protein
MNATNKGFKDEIGGHREMNIEEFGAQSEFIRRYSLESDDRSKTKIYPLDVSTVENIERELTDIRISGSFTERTNKFLTNLLQSPLLLQISSLRCFDKPSGQPMRAF